MWNIQTSTIIPPAAHGHLKIHMAAPSRFAANRPCTSDRSNRQGRAANAMHTRALRRIPVLRPKKNMCMLCAARHTALLISLRCERATAVEL